MWVFTDVEKQQLQAKIKDEQERQRVLKESLQIEKEKEAKQMKDIIFRYGLLVLFICLLIRNVTFQLERQNFGYDQYGGLVITLMLLFYHLAYNFTKKGWLSSAMKTIAWVWIAFAWAYLFWTGGV